MLHSAGLCLCLLFFLCQKPKLVTKKLKKNDVKTPRQGGAHETHSTHTRQQAHTTQQAKANQQAKADQPAKAQAKPMRNGPSRPTNAAKAHTTQQSKANQPAQAKPSQARPNQSK
jgi:hypothetical protein